MFLTLVALVFYFYLPTSVVEFDVFAESPPLPQSRIDVLQFEPNSTVTKPILDNVYIDKSYQYQTDQPVATTGPLLYDSAQKLVRWTTGNKKSIEFGELRQLAKFRVRLRLTGFQRSQFYFRNDPSSRTYARVASGFQ